MLEGFKKWFIKLLGREAKPDAEDEKAKLKDAVQQEVEAESKPAEEAKKAADAAKAEAESSEPNIEESSTQEVEKVAVKP